MAKGSVQGRNGGNGGYSKKSAVTDTKPRPIKQNIGRQGSVKAPKS